MQIKSPFIPANIVLTISAGSSRKEWSYSLSLGQGEVRGRILFSGCLGGSVHLGACLVLFKRHRPWQQRELSAYLTVKACEKEERRWTGGGRQEGEMGQVGVKLGKAALEKFRCRSRVTLGPYVGFQSSSLFCLVGCSFCSWFHLVRHCRYCIQTHACTHAHTHTHKLSGMSSSSTHVTQKKLFNH